MKELKKEKTISYTVYQAIDDTIFETKNECEQYEKTTKCMLLAKYKELVVKESTEYEIFGLGSEEYKVDRLRPLRDMNDVDTLLMFYIYCNSYKPQEDFDNTRKRLISYFNNNDIIFVGRGNTYDDSEDCYIYGSYKEICEKLLAD